MTIALDQCLKWHDALMDHEFKGRKDKESAARFRLSKKIGVPESMLFRLTHKRREMRDVSGEVYRRLMLAYDSICRHHEEAAEAYRKERLSLRENRNETAQGPG